MEMEGDGQESINVKIEKSGDQYGLFQMDMNESKEKFMLSYLERHNFIHVKSPIRKFFKLDNALLSVV
ncbi:hypothetical protein CFR80_18090 [Komagataeibacter oboediens]|uniref:Uncharacterized protein n=2 Tax=Komagataeibacter oboediens TaxID=65958 RepID=A0A318QIM9_9PROT|nr:hypothetical protein CFR80_18090 [Komagataeibacter oboediens]